MVRAPPIKHGSAVSPGFHGCPAFLHRPFPLQSSPSHPLDPSLCNQQQPSPCDCLTIPKLQLPATAPSREPAFLLRVCMAVARTVWFSFCLKVKVKSLSHVWLFATRWTVAHQAPSSMGFSRQEYWSGLPFPSPRDLPDPGVKPRSPALQGGALTSEPILFRLPQISCFTLSLKCFSSDSDDCPDVGIGPCFSSPTHWGQVQSY